MIRIFVFSIYFCIQLNDLLEYTSLTDEREYKFYIKLLYVCYSVFAVVCCFFNTKSYLIHNQLVFFGQLLCVSSLPLKFWWSPASPTMLFMLMVKQFIGMSC